MRSVTPIERRGVSRRTFLAASVLAGASAACGSRLESARRVDPPAWDTAISNAEAARPHTGRTVTAALTPQPVDVDLGGPIARTLAFGDAVPAPVIRARVGDEVAVTVANGLDHPTSVHWHGIAIRNDMDGAAPATPDIPVGGDFTYRFSVPDAGTYWAHPHTSGLDADRGLYVPLIVDNPAEPGRYDAEWIVVLDDWTDGVGPSPQQIYDGLRSRRGMSGMGPMATGRVGTSALLGGDGGDVSYPYYLINGRIPAAPTTLSAKPGDRIRMRIVNAGSDTAFRVALAGHAMTVTHTDGFPVTPIDVDAVLIGMGERYDVTVTAGDGVFPLVAMAEGKNALARALLVTGAGSTPDAAFLPTELAGRVGTVDGLTAAPQAQLGRAPVDVELSAELTGGMMGYDWAINGRPYPDAEPLEVKEGQRATLTFGNRTAMWHPMHLHGHTFQLIGPNGRPGPRKDTVVVRPWQTVGVALVADNPGTWMMHCHNSYHQESGMMTSLDYVS